MNEDRSILFEGKWLRIAARGKWEYVERVGRQNAAIIFPVLKNDDGSLSLVLIKEWRVPHQKYIIGVPAGLVGDVDNNESSLIAAGRELIEETGYSSGRIRFLCEGPSSSGLSIEMLDFYLADKLSKVNSGGGVDEDENIETLVVPINEIDNFIKEQSKSFLIDPKVYICLHFISKFDIE